MSDVSTPSRYDLLRTVAEGTAGVVGDTYFENLVRRMGVAFGARVCWIAEILEPRRSARALASWPVEALSAGQELLLAGTPAERVYDFPVVEVAERVTESCPDDPFLAEHGLDGYLAIATLDTDDEINGYLAIGTSHRLTVSMDELTALRIFAARLGAELDRRRQESRLRERETEIIASRARVVEAADEERRRIGRDLHDGVQQRLVAMTQRMDLAARAIDPANAKAIEMLAAAREQASAAAQELRELAHGLHPVGLTERGLTGAMRQLGARSQLPLRVIGLPERRLPEPIELTVYYLVSEALTNAAKHAQATELTVEAILEPRGLRVTVADDGVGGAAEGTGSGLRGLADRVVALGGTLEVSSPVGEGTTLVADIPLAPFRDERDPYIEFGQRDDNGYGDRMIEQVLSGNKRATISLAREWDLEGGPPRIGQVLPIFDWRGKKHGEVVVTHTTVLPFHLVDDTIATQVAGDHMTAEEWRANRFRYYEVDRDEIAVLFGEPDWQLTEAEPMVVTHFRVV